MQKQLEALGVKTVYSSIYPPDTTNFQTIASQMAAKKPDLIAQGAVFEDGVGLVRSLKQLNYSPKILFQTSAPSNAGQYSDGVGEANTEGVFYTVSWNQDAKTPTNPEFVAGYKARPTERRPGRGRRRRVRRGPGARRRRSTRSARSTRTSSATGCTPTTVQTILGPLTWRTTGEPQGKFLLAQWQSGKVQVVAPADGAPRRDGREPQARLEVTGT